MKNKFEIGFCIFCTKKNFQCGFQVTDIFRVMNSTFCILKQFKFRNEGFYLFLNKFNYLLKEGYLFHNNFPATV